MFSRNNNYGMILRFNTINNPTISADGLLSIVKHSKAAIHDSLKEKQCSIKIKTALPKLPWFAQIKHCLRSAACPEEPLLINILLSSLMGSTLLGF